MRPWLPDEILGQIGDISSPLQGEPSPAIHVLNVIARGIRRALLWLVLAIVSIVALAMFVIVVLDALLHVWVLPIFFAVAAFRQRRGDAKAAQSTAPSAEGVGVLDGGDVLKAKPVRTERRPFALRHPRAVAAFFLILGIVIIPWSHYVNHDPWSQAPLWVLAIWGFVGACWWLFHEFAEATAPSPRCGGTRCQI
jgi:hypothetical protein